MTGPDDQNKQEDETEAVPSGEGPVASGGAVKISPKKGKATRESKEDRLGAALRANLRRRKAQARGRKSDNDPA